MMNYTFMSEYSLYEIFDGSISQDVSEHLGGPHIEVGYPNGFGASIIKNYISHGSSEDLWELAVLHNGRLCYDTPITDDVIGYLEDSEIVSLCRRIRDLSENDLIDWYEDDEDLYDEDDQEEAMEDEDEQYD